MEENGVGVAFGEKHVDRTVVAAINSLNRSKVYRREMCVLSNQDVVRLDVEINVAAIMQII